LLRGVPSSGKTSFALTLARELIAQRDRKVVYAVTEVSPDELMAHAKHGFGWDLSIPEKEGNLVFVDGYSWRLGSGKAGERESADLTNLSDVGRELFKLIVQEKERAGKAKKDGHPFFFIFDTATTLFLYNDESDVIKFLQIQIARLRDANISALLLLEEGVNDQGLVQALGVSVDGVFELRLTDVEDEPKKSFRVFSVRSAVHQKKWFDCDVDKQGFHFLEEIPEALK
jgi:KaiC/GvpD/RAD55 family RecA-like ATPase